MSRPLLILVAVLLCGWASCHEHSHEHGHSHGGHGHGHSHGEPEEPKWHKYSKEANDLETDKSQIDSERFEHVDKDRRPTSGREYRSSQEPRSHSKFSNQNQQFGVVATWSMAILSTLIISIAPALLLLVLPVDNSKEYEPWLKVFLSYAAGGLLGDAFLHLIPHAMLAAAEGDAGHGHSHADGSEHNHNLAVGLWVILGIVCFLVMEKVTRYVRGEGGHGHAHNPAATTASAAKKKKDDDLGAGDSPRKVAKESGARGLGNAKPSAYLNLIADFFHNFTDGLAIGASFLIGGKTGIVTAITVLFHEVPHEIGDLAILIQSGLTKMEAIHMQMLTAIGAVLGTVIGLCMHNIGSWAMSGVLPFTAGGFIYLATVTAIPELLADVGLAQSVKEIVAFGFGVVLMVVISFYE